MAAGIRMPGENALRVALGVVAVLGIGVATYLTVVRAEGDSPTCVIGGGCHTVQSSEYSELAGIPVAWLGLAAYVGLLVAAILPGQAGRALGLFTAVVSFGFSAWLTYAEIVLIDAICAWCVTSAILVTIALVITILRAASPSATPGGSARRSAPDPRSPAQTPGSST
ncbi:MAG TPA: vitamin K epoxide reductase family protein [Miltoncostaeaceae bacterium]|nr:vitamin K epoxide reductase family protein [Miltoncostaeaceae bacterium]